MIRVRQTTLASSLQTHLNPYIFYPQRVRENYFQPQNGICGGGRGGRYWKVTCVKVGRAIPLSKGVSIHTGTHTI